MSNDLDIIIQIQLKKHFGKELLRLDEFQCDSVGYQLDNGRVICLWLHECECQLNIKVKEIGQLQNLQELYLDDNQLTQLPEELLQPNLEIEWDGRRWREGIHVADNPLSNSSQRLTIAWWRLK
ncbi:hypothetical protein THII_0126 [Thioploca ingrica]|uniref:Uncharacterized protein n=1 Tax=Thioploca ingrica TaxID=40754 RepID=A0A090AAD2_9GAMM|nr:hypothetical protein THII_0126 [Thioploca ingrica]